MDGLYVSYQFLFQLNTIQRLTETVECFYNVRTTSMFQLNTIQRLTETDRQPGRLHGAEAVPIKHYPTIN